MSATLSDSSWYTWAKAQPGLLLSDRAVLIALANLADSSGHCEASIRYISEDAGVSRATVFRALARLEKRDLVWRRSQTNEAGSPVASEFQIGRVARIFKHEDLGEKGAVGCCRPPRGLKQLKPDSSEYLRQVLSWGLESDWCEHSSRALEELLKHVGPRQFHTIAHYRTSLSPNERAADTLTIAWELCVKQAKKLTSKTTRNTWALLHRMVQTEAFRIDRENAGSAEVPVTEFDFVFESNPRPSSFEEREVKTVSWQEASKLLEVVENELVEAGLARETVRATHKRLIEIAVTTRKSRKHTAAAEDEELSRLVPSKNARRKWMSLLIGKRRGGGGILDSTIEERRELINEIVSEFEKLVA